MLSVAPVKRIFSSRNEHEWGIAFLLILYIWGKGKTIAFWRVQLSESIDLSGAFSVHIIELHLVMFLCIHSYNFAYLLFKTCWEIEKNGLFKWLPPKMNPWKYQVAMCTVSTVLAQLKIDSSATSKVVSLWSSGIQYSIQYSGLHVFIVPKARLPCGILQCWRCARSCHSPN